MTLFDRGAIFAFAIAIASLACSSPAKAACRPASNIADSNSGQIAACIREFSASRATALGVVPDAFCYTVYSTIVQRSPAGADTQTRNDAFCANLIEAHKRVYGRSPFWASCVGSRSSDVDSIETCLLGGLRLRARNIWAKDLIDCNIARKLHAFGQIGTTMLQDKIRSADGRNMSCEALAKGAERVIKRASNPCFSNSLDMDGTFRSCMGNELAAKQPCGLIQSEFNRRLEEAMDGFPIGYDPAYSTPACNVKKTESKIPEASSTTAENTSDEAPIAGGTDSKGSNAIVSIGLTVLTFFVGMWAYNKVIGAHSPTRSGFFIKFLYQFMPLPMLAGAINLVILTAIIAVFSAPGLYFIRWVMGLLGATYPWAWAFFINFILYALWRFRMLFAPLPNEAQKEGARFDPKAVLDSGLKLFDQSLANLSERKRLLTVEAIFRNQLLASLFVSAASTAYFAGASAWSIAKIFGVRFFVEDVLSFNAYWRYFNDLTFQLVLFEAPKTLFAFNLTALAANESSTIVAAYILFTKVVVVGAVLQSFRTTFRNFGELSDAVNKKFEGARGLIRLVASPMFNAMITARFDARPSDTDAMLRSEFQSEHD